jgi:hypothetical protein
MTRGDAIMFHTIRFRVRFLSDLQRPGEPRLQQVQLEVGSVIRARVRPWVKKTARGPIEMADLDCDDGVLLGVPFAAFRFADGDD